MPRTARWPASVLLSQRGLNRIHSIKLRSSRVSTAVPERWPHTGKPVSKSWFLNGSCLRSRCSHALKPFYPKDPLKDRIFSPYEVR